MPDITNIDQLERRIALLEQQDAGEWKSLKSSLKVQYEAIRPSNVIKNMLDDIQETVDSETDILHNGAALVSNLIADSLTTGSKNKSIRKWLSLVLFSVATFFVSRHREEIEEGGEKLLDYVSDQLKKSKERLEKNVAPRSEVEQDDNESSEIEN